MHNAIHKLIARLPLSFRVLYRQFLLRVIDLESLSIEADVTSYLGQFAGVLIMLSILHAFITYICCNIEPTPAGRLAFCWHMEHYLIATTMLVVGLFSVASWDSTFPDRRDVMVLSPLPIAPYTILFAKVSASVAILGLVLVTLNVVSGILCPLLFGAWHGTILGLLQSCVAYWFTMIAASAFLYGSVLTVQGFTALLLPRRAFLRLSAILQLAAFGLFLAVYFMQPTLSSTEAIAAPENHWIVASSPSYWFFALFNQLNGSLPTALAWMAERAGIGLILSSLGAAASLLLCYMHTMKKTVEEPDLVPGSSGLRWMPTFGSSRQTALVLFSIRSLTRSRQHRVAFAFYLALIFAIALGWLRSEVSTPQLGALPLDFLISTFMMMIFAVVGLRSVFSLPISLTANWVLRTTQLHPSEKYIAATRRCLLLFAVVPIGLLSAVLSLNFRPVQQVVAHLAFLAIFGWILAEFSLIGFYKVPFTCSYLPGSSNVQLVFWAFVLVCLPLVINLSEYELSALNFPFKFSGMVFAFAAVAFGLWRFNHHRAKSAVLYFEELPEEIITTLRLSA